MSDDVRGRLIMGMDDAKLVDWRPSLQFNGRAVMFPAMSPSGMVNALALSIVLWALIVWATLSI